MHPKWILWPGLVLVVNIHAQLLTPGTPVPITAKPPIVFLNGYQSNCSNSQFSSTFGKFDQLFQATSRVTLFFDNCTISGKPAIEVLGAGLGTFLAALQYTDGTPVTQVDIVAHSMGGMIVRSYLAGKQVTEGSFQPPADPGVRKMVFLAVPNSGTPIASQFGLDVQANELANGSLFNFDLDTWNQGTDDLRGIDTLGVVGNGGTGRAIMSGFDDGVVSLTSASIGFAGPGRTRIIPYCHTGPGLVTLGGLCPFGAPGIADGEAASDQNAALVLSFLNDTPDWQTIGQAAEQNPLLSTVGGLMARAKSPTDQFLSISQATASKALNIQGNEVAWTELLPAQQQDLVLTTAQGALEDKFTLPAGYTSAIIVKSGPRIARVQPSAAAVKPLAVAPGEIVAIYGTDLPQAQVSAGGAAIIQDYNSATQINGIVPDSAAGLVTFTAANTDGSNTVNVLVQDTAPAIFSQDQSGTGAAAALNALSEVLVTAGAPLHAGDYVSLYLTGLGAVHTVSGLQLADQQPAVTLAGLDCPVTYAGRAPGFPGLDQINCRIPATAAPGASAPVMVTSGGRSSNVVTLAIQ